MGQDEKPAGDREQQTVLDELRKAYAQQGVLEPRTPYDKATNRIKAADQLTRQHHLELESSIQESLEFVTAKMTSAQIAQDITFISKEVENILSSGEDSLTQEKSRIKELVDSLDTQVDQERNRIASEITVNLNKGVDALVRANAALIQARNLDELYVNIKALKGLLQELGNQQTHSSGVH